MGWQPGPPAREAGTSSMPIGMSDGMARVTTSGHVVSVPPRSLVSDPAPRESAFRPVPPRVLDGS